MMHEYILGIMVLCIGVPYLLADGRTELTVSAVDDRGVVFITEVHKKCNP